MFVGMYVCMYVCMYGCMHVNSVTTTTMIMINAKKVKETTASAKRWWRWRFNQPRPARRANQTLMFTTFLSEKCGSWYRCARRLEVSALKYQSEGGRPSGEYADVNGVVVWWAAVQHPTLAYASLCCNVRSASAMALKIAMLKQRVRIAAIIELKPSRARQPKRGDTCF